MTNKTFSHVPNFTGYMGIALRHLAEASDIRRVLDLPAGKYQLACLIAKGQAGSAVDHYQQGMVVPFEVR